MKNSSGRDHYSYAIYADPAVAERFDRAHFGGPIGQLVAEREERVLLDFAGHLQGKTVLDVGTGTGRAALVLARNGALVTGVDASEEMLKVARLRSSAEKGAMTFLLGDAHALAFPDRSFDIVVSLRMLMHTVGWQRCLGELCRVAKQYVVFDYPPLMSAAALQVFTRKAVNLAGHSVETYRAISTASVRSTLKVCGFDILRLHRQFLLPIAFHKLVGSRAFTERTEGIFAAMGLSRVFGAPVTIVADRRVA